MSSAEEVETLHHHPAKPFNSHAWILGDSEVGDDAWIGAVSDDFEVAALTRVVDSLTAHQVRIWKTHAAAAAHALTLETQVEVWGTAIEALADRAGK